MILEQIERLKEGKNHVRQGNGNVQWSSTIQGELAINKQRGNPKTIMYHTTKAKYWNKRVICLFIGTFNNNKN